MDNGGTDTEIDCSILCFCARLSSEYFFFIDRDHFVLQLLNFSLSIKVGLVGYYSTAHFSVSGFVNCADGVL